MDNKDITTKPIIDSKQELCIIDEDKKQKISILDIFDKNSYTETSSAYKMVCPDCGLQGGRTEGFILYPENNQASCHSSGKWFKLLEAYALKKGIIKCLDGRETGDTHSKILGGELYTATLEAFKDEYGSDKYDQLAEQLRIKKDIKLPGNNAYVSKFCDELGEIYKSRNILFFRPESRDIIEIGKIRQADNKMIESGFMVVTPNRFVTLIEMLTNPFTTKPTKDGEEIIYRSMNVVTACEVLESPYFQNKLPIIARIFDIQIPIIHDNKLVFPKRGYDKRFNSWVPYNAPQIQIDVPLDKAKDTIEFMLREFPFRTPLDKTYAIAGLITPFLRGLFPTFSTRTPIFIYMANRERSGKDYLAGINGMIYEGVHIQQTPICTSDQRGGESEELRKKITSAIKEGRKRFHSSNNKGVLNNSTFEAITTSEDHEDRLLGTNKTVTYKNEIDFSLSGNLGLKLTPDIINRGRVINLHLVEENANARKFKNPYLHEWVFTNRNLVISCLYALVRNWFEKGSPKGSTPFASFPKWSEICGGIMEAAGYDNPCALQDEALTSLDPETEEMKYLFESVYKIKPNQWMLKSDIVEVIRNEPDIMNYYNFDDKSDQTKFGIKIDKFIDRELSGITMTVDSLKQRASRRKYRFYMLQNKEIDKIEKTEMLPDLATNTTFGTLIHSGHIQEINKYPIRVDYNSYQGYQGYQNNIDKPNPQPMVTQSDFGNLDNTNSTTPQNSSSSENLSDFNLFVDNFKKTEQKLKEKSSKKKEKTDRELQFFESPETSDIVEKCTEIDVYNWVKLNPGRSYIDLENEVGLGSLKWVNLLCESNKIKPLNEGWEVSNGEM